MPNNDDSSVPTVPAGAKAIPLWGKSRIVAWALVDESDYDHIATIRWNLNPSSRTQYAIKTRHVNGRCVNIYMHREVLGLPHGSGRKVQVDHLNACGLDNRRSNLRAVTATENNRRRRPLKTNTSGHVGIVRSYKGWKVDLVRDGKHLPQTHHERIEEAIAARDTALALYESKRHQVSA